MFTLYIYIHISTSVALTSSKLTKLMLSKAFILTVLKSLTSCPGPSEGENVNECCVPAFVYRILIFIRIHFCFCETIPDLSGTTKRAPLHKPAGRLVASAADKLDHVPRRFLSQFNVKFYSRFPSLFSDPCPQTSWVHHCFYVFTVFSIIPFDMQSVFIMR